MKQLRAEEILSELKHFKVQPRFKTEPWLHQLVCFYIGLCRPEFLFLLDMGAGKSKIVLDLMTQAQREKKLDYALVTVPRLINLGSWETATLEHSELEPCLAMGSIEEKYERLIKPSGDITIIDYPGLQLALTKKVKSGKRGVHLERDDKKVREIQRIYNFITIDEIHKCKNPESLRFGILRQLTNTADYRYGLTGTPFGRDPAAVWGQFFLIDRGASFGETLGMFRAAFFKETVDYWAGTSYVFDKRMDRKYYQTLQHRSIRYEEDELDDLPKLAYQKIELDFLPDQREQYLRAIEQLVSAQSDPTKMENSFIRLRQISAGYLSWKDEYGPHLVEFSENAKLDAIERLVDEAGEEKVVIFHEYTQSGKMITERLKKMEVEFVWLYGGSKNPVSLVDKFKNNPKIRVFVANSESGGTGVDGLQKVCRYLVFYESPVDPITRKQAIKRVHRPNQKNRVFVYDLIIRKSIDLRVLSFIEEGRNLFEALVNGNERAGSLRLS